MKVKIIRTKYKRMPNTYSQQVEEASMVRVKYSIQVGTKNYRQVGDNSSSDMQEEKEKRKEKA